MGKSRFYLTLVVAVLAAGCEDVYQIEVTPDGDSFRRELSCWHVDQQNQIKPLPKEKLDRIGKFYAISKTSPDGSKHVFVGRFAESTPPDLGGAGCYMRFRSLLGDTYSYVERFGSKDDPEETLAKQRAAADRLVDLLIGWMEHELGRDPRLPYLKRFLDNQLRKDVKNLALYGWAGDVATAAKGRSDGEPLLRVLLYLWERDYIRRSEIPILARAISAEDSERLVRFCQRLVARRMGVLDEDPIPANLAFLGSRQRQRQSLDAYIRTTELYQQRLAQWEQRRKDDPDLQQPQPEDLMKDLLAEAFGSYHLAFTSLAHRESITLRLRTGLAPYATNGKWDGTAATVVFQEKLYEHRAIPAVCFALWSAPDEQFQRRHFGGVILSGGELARYVLWYNTLSKEEAFEWDGFLSGLKPEGDIAGAVRAFRFAAEPKPDPLDPDAAPASWADEAKRLLLEGLSAQQKNQRR